MKITIQNTPKDLFQTKETYLKFIKTWKSQFKDSKKPHIKSSHYLLYAILRNKDWRKCFTPTTNSTKINNGHLPYQSIFNAFFSLKYMNLSDLSIYDGSITPELIKKLLNYLPNISEFDRGNKIPFSPYKNIETVCSSS